MYGGLNPTAPHGKNTKRTKINRRIVFCVRCECILPEIAVEIALQQKETRTLMPTIILHQTSLWSSVKFRLGWAPYAFDFTSQKIYGDMLVLVRRIHENACIAYVPQGPEMVPDEDSKGIFLESLSQNLMEHLPDDCTFIRYDLPWETPYASDPARYDAGGRWLGCPDPSFRELRMNIGTQNWNMRKALTDIQPPDTVIIDLSVSEDEMLERMKPKTRYNIRLAERKGVTVIEAGTDRLRAWYKLYMQTAERARFTCHGYEHFAALFDAHRENHASASVHLLLAVADGEELAGAILSLSKKRATYLYGASANSKRNYMAPYALQWQAMRFARRKGCTEYDLFGISPTDDPTHLLYGLYRFKTGFGGYVMHRQGCWDYPLRQDEYNVYRSSESLQGVFHR